MQTHQSIEAIHKVFQTNDRPVLATCEDLNDYVCKYRYVERQFNELLAWAFLKEWGIPVPDASLVTVKPEHVTAEALREGARLAFFERPVFGSIYLQHAREVDNSLTALGANRNDVLKIQNRVDLLRIALFDLWTANEDRNGNNYNLLLVPIQSGKFFIHAIDHAACFNSSNVGQYTLSPLTEEDSVLSTDFCRLLYANSTVLKRDGEIVLSSFRQKVALCAKALPKIVNFVPPLWSIDTAERHQWLIENLFDDTWLSQAEADFRHYLQLLLR
ncbi:HipA family kinase [Spirosoma sp.]|uniref:HipA family kinase n=1 Tax=Spirosoma sp. TaxID=1899569 RepID=UPI003B3B39EA